uniref:Uncharacterized protein n=1 Tax=Cacopsylla melanoneura TaxID=428564 RepID=A0A8D8UP64_9HEMI
MVVLLIMEMKEQGTPSVLKVRVKKWVEAKANIVLQVNDQGAVDLGLVSNIIVGMTLQANNPTVGTMLQMSNLAGMKTNNPMGTPAILKVKAKAFRTRDPVLNLQANNLAMMIHQTTNLETNMILLTNNQAVNTIQKLNSPAVDMVPQTVNTIQQLNSPAVDTVPPDNSPAVDTVPPANKPSVDRLLVNNPVLLKVNTLKLK